MLVVAAEHELAGREGLHIKDLEGQDWCAREAQSSTSARLRYLLHEHIGQIRVAFEATSNWAVRHAVIAGVGLAAFHASWWSLI